MIISALAVCLLVFLLVTLLKVGTDPGILDKRKFSLNEYASAAGFSKVLAKIVALGKAKKAPRAKAKARAKAKTKKPVRAVGALAKAVAERKAAEKKKAKKRPGPKK